MDPEGNAEINDSWTYFGPILLANEILRDLRKHSLFKMLLFRLNAQSVEVGRLHFNGGKVIWLLSVS